MVGTARLRNGAGLREPAPLVEALLKPSAYCHHVTDVELRETHISWVFLTDDRVYKVKKPVRFPFLDFSTLERRRRACEAEVVLNRRLAGDVYLGVLPVQRLADGRICVGEQGGETIDYAVAMKRLPAERMMDWLLDRRRVTASDVRRLARRLVEFYRTARRSPEFARYATREAIEENVRDNLETLMRRPDVFGCELLRRLESAQLQFVWMWEHLFEDRIAAGYVCEGHGDLRPEHICLIDPPAIYDCVEFSESLRVNDVVNDLAFLAMELDLAGEADLAEALFEEYRRASGDFVPRPLVQFYKAYRALVRAKVSLLRAAQQPPEAAARMLERARDYAWLAASYDAEYHVPLAIAVIGPSGAGKTTLACELAGRIGAMVVRSDAVRQKLAGRREPDAPPETGIYAPAMTRRVYEALVRDAEYQVRENRTTVVLDATFSSRSQRELFRRCASACGMPYAFLYCDVPPEVAMRRVVDRRSRGVDISDARPEIVARHYTLFAIARDLTRPDVWRVDATDATSAVTQAMEYLRPFVAALTGK